jgi:hypothetical protein
MTDSTREFIKNNADGDVRQLALQASRHPDVDMPLALDQIAGRQTARCKLPSWASVDGILYPPHISMEQCSSEFTARYKASVAARITDGDAHKLVDLTGGFGIDFSFMSRSFDEAVYVERQEHLCNVARHNFQLLDMSHIKVVCGDSADYLHTLDHASLIFLDPARRDANGGKTVAISDCTPDVMALKDELLEKADHVMLKLSPMLDWHKAVTDLGCVAELYIVSVANECKELLLVLSSASTSELRICCVNDESVFDYDESTADGLLSIAKEVTAGTFLYEPNASVMKAGCFSRLCSRYGVKALECNSHLFVSPEKISLFPGRGFRIDAVSTMNKKELKQVLSSIDRANVAVRNFPLSADNLRKRLKLKDGGGVYIFATTLSDHRHVLLICSKI